MRVLVVDDEPIARAVLRAFLERDAEVTAIDECGDGVSAMEALRTVSYDLLFLDVRMPGADGLDVLASDVTSGATDGASLAHPVVVFVTAFEDHAVDAFAVGAVDYLLKPFDDRRFARTLERAKERRRERELAMRGRELAELLGRSLGQETPVLDRLSVPSGSGLARIDLESISWVEAQDKYVLIHSDDQGEVRVRQTFSEIERQLDTTRFLRVHRSCIVAVRRVVSLDRTDGGVGYARLDTGARVVVSRSRWKAVRERLQGSLD